MKKTKQVILYVTDWAPNGTNDLLICDEDHQIVDSVESATFGIDVTKLQNGERQLVANSEDVFPVDDEIAADWKQNEYVPSEFTLVRQIDIDTLRRKLCVSPLDPDGSELIGRLKRAGVKV